ncbi:MAG: glycerophosphodiester phosphodiesterase family protein [Clostridium sp.]|nr:glycerophosphodiester phosphodiesterase family protein [Clostridium sp.]
MSEIKGMIKDIFSNFKYNIKSTIIFELFYKLICLFLFIPINYNILNKFLKDIGTYNITNKDLIKLGLTSEGIVYIIIVLIISFIGIFIEIGILTYLAYNSHEKKKANFLEGTINAFSIFPKVPSIYMICIILISGVIGPLTGVGVYSSLITRFTVPAFIKVALFKTLTGKIIYWTCIVFLILLLLRWVLAIPIMIIENVTFKEAFKNSLSIYKRNRMKIIFNTLIWTILNYAIRFVMLGGIVYISTILLGKFERNYISSSMIMSIGLVMFFIVYITLSVITLPLFISFLVELYYRLKFYDINERIFVPIDYYKNNKVYSWLLKNRHRLVVLTLATFVIISTSMGLAAILNNAINKNVNITAHRGSSLTAPENSISAIKNAISEGADYVEIDVMTTKDDEVVVFHDSTLKRMAGINNSIKDMNLSEVREIDIGSQFSEEFAGEKIPTFKEVLRASKDKIKINIELKVKKKDDPLPEKVVELLKKYEMEDQVIISSQDYESLQKIKEVDPLINVGFILTLGIGDFTKMNVDFVSVEYQMLKKDLVYSMHALGKEVHVWTINDKKRAENAMKLGADNIITDSVEMVQKASTTFNEKEDIDYVSKFYDSIYSLLKYVKI